MAPSKRSVVPTSKVDHIVAEAAARVADSTMAALRSMFSESFIRGVIEREAKIAVQAALLAEAERIRLGTPAPMATPAAPAPAPQPKELIGLPSQAPLAYRPKKACEILGLSRSTLYKMISEGTLGARKIGSATIIRKEDIDAYLAGLPPTLAAAKAAQGKAR